MYILLLCISAGSITKDENENVQIKSNLTNVVATETSPVPRETFRKKAFYGDNK